MFRYFRTLFSSTRKDGAGKTKRRPFNCSTSEISATEISSAQMGIELFRDFDQSVKMRSSFGSSKHVPDVQTRCSFGSSKHVPDVQKRAVNVFKMFKRDTSLGAVNMFEMFKREQ
jgi:hypothetical protein